MKIVWARAALKAIKRQPGLKVEFDVLIEHWMETGRGDVIRLRGIEGFRARIRDWRAVFDRTEDGAIVFKAGHRRNIYRR